MAINNATVVGRITRDLEAQVNQNGNKYVSFSLAVQRDKDTADFINCLAYNKSAEIITTYCSKGSMLGVNGSIRTGSYTDQNGVKRSTFNIFVNNVMLLDSKKNETQEQQTTNNDSFNISDEDLPF